MWRPFRFASWAYTEAVLRVGCHPCGAIAGDIRFPYRAMMRTVQGEPPAQVVWFFARPDAVFLPRDNSFRSGMSYLDRWGENQDIGEIHPRDPTRQCKEYPYSGTQQPPAFYTGQNYCGSDEVWRRGAIPGVDPIFSTDANGVSTCCQRPQMIGSGGDVDGGDGMIDCQDFPIWATRLLGCGGDVDGGEATTHYGDVTDGAGGDVDGGHAPMGPEPQYLAQKFNSTNVAVNMAYQKPTGTAAGDLLLLVGLIPHVAGPTPPLPSGFTSLAAGAAPGGLWNYRIAYRIADGTEGSSFPAAIGATRKQVSYVVRLGDAAVPTEYDADGGNGDDYTTPLLTTSVNGTARIAIYANDQQVLWDGVLPSGAVDQGAAGPQGLAVAFSGIVPLAPAAWSWTIHEESGPLDWIAVAIDIPPSLAR